MVIQLVTVASVTQRLQEQEKNSCERGLVTVMVIKSPINRKALC